MTDQPKSLVEGLEKLLKGGIIVDENDSSKIMGFRQSKLYGGLKTVSDLAARLIISAAIKDKRQINLVKIILSVFWFQFFQRSLRKSLQTLRYFFLAQIFLNF